jgi:hypothetical protein
MNNFAHALFSPSVSDIQTNSALLSTPDKPMREIPAPKRRKKEIDADLMQHLPVFSPVLRQKRHAQCECKTKGK